MGEIQLINIVNEWERRREIEDERRENRRTEPYVNYLAAPQSWRKERRSIFARLFQPRKERQASVDFIKALTDKASTGT